ncbi:Chaperone of endosialidase [Dyadobacter sp. SG02]|nr:Chaperone of endosialidase [Dyadobacter sp. SG02]
MICVLDHGLANAQIGIGTAFPKARLHVYNGAFLSQTPTLGSENSPFYDPLNFDDDPVHHAFKWMHEKSAFRAVGKSIFNQAIDPTAVGKYSFASGFDAFATGLGSSAIGLRTRSEAFATFASGQFSIAYGSHSFAQGNFASADGPGCISMGTNLANNYLIGAFILGHAVVSSQSTDNHQIKMLFGGGYRFFTTSNLSTGILLAADANAWSVISDVRKKENFAPINGKGFLDKIAGLPLSSWNYKEQDVKTCRHYGAMAQDFFAAFGKDAYGSIGSDTTINQSDLDGVTLIAIQALAEETDDLQTMNDDLERELLKLRAQLSVNNDFRMKKHAVLASKPQ